MGFGTPTVAPASNLADRFEGHKIRWLLGLYHARRLEVKEMDVVGSTLTTVSSALQAGRLLDSFKVLVRTLRLLWVTLHTVTFRPPGGPPYRQVVMVRGARLCFHSFAASAGRSHSGAG